MNNLCALAADHQADKVTKVTVSIGTLSGVVVDSFRFGFDVLAPMTPVTSDAVLDIKLEYPLFVCSECGYETREQALPPRTCKECGSRRFERRGGDELVLLQVQMV